MRYDPKFIACYLALGVACACAVGAMFGHACFVSVGMGAWLTGGWLAQKMIDKEDDDE